jgi:glycosidase
MTWWQRGLIYQIYPRSFMDSNGDGTGDLPGIISRLDYLEWLGVDAIWISPIFPSPMADFGYDVSDYTSIDPLFGTLDDFDRLLADAHRRGLRVLLDYVPNHTSDRHPWFLESRSSRDNRRSPEQLAERLRRQRLGVGRQHRPVLPPHVCEGAAGPQLGEPGGRGRHVRRPAILV